MKLFDYDSGFMRAATILSRLTLLNIFWLVCCIPIVTIGASTVAMHYSALQLMNGNRHVIKTFKEGFSLHWKRSSIVWLIQAILAAAFFVFYMIIYNNEIPAGTILAAVAGIAFLTMVFVSLWIGPVMIQFSGSLTDILFNAFVFAFMYAPLTLGVVVLYGAAGYLAVRYFLARGLLILFGPALVVYITLTVFGKAFEKYKKEPVS